jgi:2-amino-4-hydroxy-6-hydroxymethyldihydropteridine diphosphokinase
MSAVVQVCIGLGANLGDAQATLRQALAALSADPAIHDLQASALYRSRAWGREDQPDFINACACFSTALPPLALLDRLQALEHAHGRQRLPGGHWGPRTLDLDILLYGDRVIDQERLQVPHPWMLQRAFVLLPLAELAPARCIPGFGTVAQGLAALDASEVQPIGG